MQPTRFSIVITCYNQQDFIRTAVESALSQLDSRKEIIVVDDGSSDGSLEILEQYRDSIDLVKFSSNQGAIEARNYAAARARGEYLVFLDGDDALMSWALAVYEKIIAERNPRIILARSLWFRGMIAPVESENVPCEIGFVEYETFLRKDRAAGLSASAYVVNRQAFWDAGGWSPGIFHLDLQDLSTKLGFEGRVILICSPSTVFYRIHTSNSILTVPPFLEMAHRLLNKERAGGYPGGRSHRLERYAWFGGLVLFWMKRALRAGLIRQALRLAGSGWLMILAAIFIRSKRWLGKRRPVETLPLAV